LSRPKNDAALKTLPKVFVSQIGSQYRFVVLADGVTVGRGFRASRSDADAAGRAIQQQFAQRMTAANERTRNGGYSGTGVWTRRSAQAG
jgi:hypothetical protein